MTPRNTVLLGDVVERLRELPDNSIDAIVTDPPYGIEFMGKEWDGWSSSSAFEEWCRQWGSEALRTLRPGGHILAFGGTRMYHRLVAGLEDAGFEIRDTIAWLYGSGFPKSLDVSKAIDKQRHDRAEIYRVTAWIRAARDAAGIGNGDIDAAFGFRGMAGHWTSAASQPAVPTLDQVPLLLATLGVAPEEVPEDIRRLLWDLNGRKGQPGAAWFEREVVGHKQTGLDSGSGTTVAFIGSRGRDDSGRVPITAPATDAARTWAGFGTALKPAHEPIVVARKPLAGTVAANVQAHGTGALNIDGCRVGTDNRPLRVNDRDSGNFVYGSGLHGSRAAGATSVGRWPANVVLSHSPDCVEQIDRSWQCSLDCAVRLLDEQSGKRGGAVPASGPTYSGPSKSGSMAGAFRAMGDKAPAFHGDTGGASRFFYCAKASRSDREAGLTGLPTTQPVFNGHNAEPSPSAERDGSVENKFRTSPRQNDHPTVKPHELMRWLCRLVGGQPGSLILDPFAGSGSTLRAAKAEGFDFLGIERDRHYYRLACLRAGLPDPGEDDEMAVAA